MFKITINKSYEISKFHQQGIQKNHHSSSSDRLFDKTDGFKLPKNVIETLPVIAKKN